MAAHNEPGASEAISLLRNASHVSSFCNDVVGDICGIVSGTTAAVIVVQLQQMLTVHTVLLSVGVTALISGPVSYTHLDVYKRQVQETETRMETILTKIDGVGELHLMLTADTGTSRRLAENTELSYSGDTAAPNDYQRKSETVLSGGSGTEEPVVTAVSYTHLEGKQKT